ncbi:UNVERIFIED_CONTAM: Transcription factor [Sesamum latifolium]|uniref:Transcription factor n=1 Tax=Sesamum latifolium TaxID=2727402 RepID=A0AAW2XEA1_9LAMI
MRLRRRRRRRRGCCEKEGLRRGAWSAEEDKILVDFITQNGHTTWRNLPQLSDKDLEEHKLHKSTSSRDKVSSGVERAVGFAGLTIFDPTSNVVPLVAMKRIPLSICSTLGNKWAAIASNLLGRTDNDVKNFWNSHLRKRFSGEVLDQTSSLSKSVETKHESPQTRLFVQSENVRVETAESVCLVYLKMTTSNACGILRARSLNEPCKKTSSHGQTDQKVELLNCKKEAEEFGSYSDDSKSDDSSDTMLKILLDFPMGGNDMEFLQDPSDDVSTATLH